MIKFDVMYRMLGVRKIAHFVHPHIIDATTFEFPINSMMYWYNVSDIVTPVTKQYPYFNTIPINMAYVKTILDYNENNTLGSYRNAVRQPVSILRDITLAEKQFKFFRLNAKELPISDKATIIVNYGALNYMYAYNAHPLMRYYKWYNSFEKMTSQLQQKNYKTARSRFVLIKVPAEMFTRQEFDKYAIRVTNANIDNIPINDYFSLIDIWRFLSPDLKQTSLLNNIPENEYYNTTLMFVLDTKLVLLNLGVLNSIVTEYTASAGKYDPAGPAYRLDYKIQKYKAEVVRKLYLALLNAMIEEEAKTLADLAAASAKETDADIILGAKTGVTGDTATNTKVTTIDIDDHLDNTTANKVVVIKPADANAPDTKDEPDESTLPTTDEIQDIAATVIDQKIATKEDIKAETIDGKNKLLSEVSALSKFGVISKNETAQIKDILDKQDEKQSPWPNDFTSLKDMLDPKQDTYNVSEEEVAITDNPVIFNKKLNKDPINALERKYIKEQYKKDMARVVYSVQNHNIVVADYKVTETESILGKSETHTFMFKSPGRLATKADIIIPKIEDNGTFKLSSNTYRMRKQRADIPIRKINFNEVALSSNAGKLFITKATVKKDDAGYWLRNQIIKKYDTGEVRDLVFVNGDIRNVVLPKTYAYIARYIRSFNYGDALYHFDYNSRFTLFPKIPEQTLKDLEEDGLVLVGSQKGNPLFMNNEEKLYMFANDKFVEQTPLLEQLKVDLDDAPVEFTTIKIFNKALPTVILLAYYLGLNNLMKTLKVKYSFTPDVKRVATSKTQYSVAFSDGILLIDKDYGDGDLVLSGLLSIKAELKTIPYSIMQTRDKFPVLYSKLKLPQLYTNDIRLMEDMFVDPITLTILQNMKEPTTFKGLLIRANEMLVDDNYKDPGEATETILRGYERIPGMVYRELLNAIRDHDNRSYWSKSSISINPYNVSRKINEDSTTVLVDDLNPIAMLKQTEDTTFLGADGRSKESMSKDTRITHVSERGIISEASKDSGDVGISAYLTAIPKIENTRGKIGSFNFKDDSWGSIFSTSAMLAPFARTDDVKRLKIGAPIQKCIVYKLF